MAYNYNKHETFQVETPVNMETTHGVLDSSNNEKMEVTVGVDTKANYGYFEIYDIASGGDRFYGEGGLWFSGNKLTDYDGVFELSQFVTKKLNEWGYDTSDVE
ncbi:unnamed protein product [marine sediment metagenome]|uniref:Uncharacterized protein n=1 Tax=marine sediment metagenome TaxID=412755 RepID=X0U4S1_9ZZZZ